MPETTVRPHEERTFPKVLDNTILATYRACPRKAYWLFHRNAAPRSKSIHLIAGGALAKGHEVFRVAYWSPQSPIQGDFEACLKAGLLELYREYGFWGPLELEWADDAKLQNKSAINCGLAFVDYWYHFHPATDHLIPHMVHGEPAAEFSFSIPLDIHHPETGDPLLYNGRFDLLGHHTKYDTLWVTDEKSTGALGASWANQWDLRSQFMGYVWGAQQHGFDIAGTIIRGTSLQKTQIKHAEVVVPVQHWLVELWYQNLQRTIQQMIRDWEEQVWDYSFGDACTSYGGCGYKTLCTKRDPEPWVDVNFHHRVWDPSLGDLERGKALAVEELESYGLGLDDLTKGSV